MVGFVTFVITSWARTLQVTFTWSGKLHDVTSTPSPACADYTSLYEPTEDGDFSVTFNETGTFYYACSVGDHCDEGQKITINVA